MFNQSTRMDLRDAALFFLFVTMVLILFFFLNGAIVALILIAGLLSKEIIASIRPYWTSALTFLNGLIIPTTILFTYHIVIMLM